MNQLLVGMEKIPVEQGSGYNVAYYILVEEAETEDGVLCDQYGLRVVLLGFRRASSPPASGRSPPIRTASIAWRRRS